MQLRYSYRTLLTFSSMVSSHTFMLRCVPYLCWFQHRLCHTTSVIPHCEVTSGCDSFGNVVQTGYVAGLHDAFMFESTGIVDVSMHVLSEPLNRIFCYASPLTTASPEMLEMVKQIDVPTSEVDRWVAALSARLHLCFDYVSGTTDVTTTAAEAFQQHHGVCQDFAHISIAMGRAAGIPMRYVNGFMMGEGATHAWVEYYNGSTWLAFDPTNDRPVDDTYIKLAHGRDFNDCSINRGRFCGQTSQTIHVSVLVTKV